MSKKEQKLKKNLYKALTEYFIQNISFIMLKTIWHHQKVFWISLPLFAWKQDYLPHSDKIKNIKQLRKTVIKPTKKCRI